MRRSLVVAAALAALLATAAPAAAQSLPQAGCDPLDPAVCLQPWPNDFFTRPDASTPTGKRLDLPLLGDAAQRRRRPDPPRRVQPQRRLQPGLADPHVRARARLRAHRPGADHGHGARVRRRPARRRDRRRQRRAAADLGGDGRQREVRRRPQPLHPPGPQLGGGPPLHRRPAQPARRPTGTRLEAQPAFRAYRDKDPGTRKPADPRREHMDELFKTLNKAGVKRKDLYLAWDFTVGSEQRISERMLGIRDDAFAALGDTDLADSQVVGQRAHVPRHPGAGHAERPADHPHGPRHLHRARATSTSRGCPPGSKFLYTDLDSNTPTRDPRQHGGADVHLHRPALGAGRPAARLALRPRPVRQPERGDAGNVKTMAADHGFVFCATDWWGMAQQDVADHGRDPGRPVELRAPARPRPAGDAQLPAARAADDPPAGPRGRPGLPARRPLRARHPRAVLRRQLAGRDHRRLADRGRARLPPRRARRARA